MDEEYIFKEECYQIIGCTELTNIHKGQLFNYLKASDKRLGMLINFGPEKLEYKRFIF
ncbi:MAG: GxxExxY protein [Bacteroidota bacterium]